MQTDRWQTIERVFFEALEKEGDARARYLEGACGGDDELRREVEAMLASTSDDAALRIEARLEEAHSESESPPQRTGTVVGSYRLRRVLGRGGMGEVYLAERADGAFRQQVAVKLLAGVLPGPEAVRRFKTERQILARLNHPNIAKLVDGGMGDDGRPYLVMHAIEGTPITEYCEARALGVEPRLVLFKTVCEAVQYANQNLVIHRDLKPSNVLVTEQGEVKLLDFGIAKLLESDDELSLAETGTDMRLMTPEYASPEQVRGESVTTATDVYALGALLYRMLTGKGPFPSRGVDRAALERAILEATPQPPSQVVDDPERQRWLRGDLDKIVLMALRKEPERRYGTAGEMGDDVRRYLAHLPVRAQRDTLRYRSRKFVRRNPIAITAAAVIGVLIVAFGAVTAVQAGALANQRDAARADRDRAEQVVQVLVDLFETSDPTLDPSGDTLRVGQFLAQSEQKVIAQLAEQPELQARMKHVLGKVYVARKQFAEARGLLEDAVEQQRAVTTAPDSVTARIFLDLGMAVKELEGPGAEPLLRTMLEMQQQVYGDLHPDVGHAMSLLGPVLPDPADRMAVLERALEIRRATLPAGHPDIANSITQVGVQSFLAGDYAAAAEHWRDALHMLQRAHSDEHPDVLTVTGDLATAYWALGELDSAEALNRRIVEARRRLFGYRSAPVAVALNNLATVMAFRHDYAGAEQSFREVLTIWEEVYGRQQGQSLNTAQYANTARNVAITLQYQGRHDDALRWFGTSIESQRAFAGADAEQTVRMRVQRANLLTDMGRAGASADTLERLVPLLRQYAADGGSQFLAEAENWLGRAQWALGNGIQAEFRFRAAAEYRRRVMGPDAGPTAESEAGLGLALAAQGRWEEAEAILRPAYERYREYGNLVPMYLRELQSGLADVYDALERPADAARVRDASTS